jgi:hypothetical protein
MEMSPRISIQLACGLLGIAIVTGCTGTPAASHHVASHHAASSAAPPAPQPVTRMAARQCPKTNFTHAAGLPGVSAADLVPGTTVYGHGKLRVTLSLNGVIVASGNRVHPDGSISWKLPWWRMAAGYLTITGRRLDAPAPPLMSMVPGGYGDIGFQASGVTFPSEGCWQVTGQTDHASLTFVTLVITQAHRAVISRIG